MPQGTDHADADGDEVVLKIKCEEGRTLSKPRRKFNKCEKEEICAKIAATNKEIKKPGGLRKRRGSKHKGDQKVQRDRGNDVCKEINKAAEEGNPEDLGFHDGLSEDCEKKLRKKAEQQSYKGFSADHVKAVVFVGGLPVNRKNLRWMSSSTNSWTGFKIENRLARNPDKYTKVEGDCCN